MRVRFALLLLTLLAAGPALLRAATVVGTVGLDTGTPSGTDAAGRVYVYTPSPLQPGSSVSHWDVSAFPNLLMEPSINSDLEFQELDLTLFQLRDVGWGNGSSNITLHVQDAAGQGFDDPSLGTQRLAAVQRVAQVYANRLRSPVEIHVDIGFDQLTCSADGATLAQAGANFLFESFAGAPMPGVWYHGALAESLAGANLSLEDTPDPDAGDLSLTFNSRIDQSCLGSGSRFYYGLDGNVPDGQISFVAVALHEMAHGLGFASFTDASTGAFFLGLPDIYAHYLFDNQLGRRWDQMTVNQRRSSAISGRNVAWSGPQVRAQADNFLEPGPALLIASPSSIAGSYPVATAAFGPPVSAPGVTGEIVAARDGSPSPTLLCNSAVNGAEISGKIALVDRGDCNFTVKVKNAQVAGATAVVVVNNVAGDPPTMGGSDATIHIPSVGITQANGEAIRDALQQAAQPGVIAFTQGQFSVDEAAEAAAISIRRSGGKDGAVTVDLVVVGGGATPEEDYDPAIASIELADGESGVRTFSIGILDDLEVEGDETLELALEIATGDAQLGTPGEAALTIVDDDVFTNGELSFSTDRFRDVEGETLATVTVDRIGGSDGEVTVDYATGGGTAEPLVDYLPTSGTLVFADGSSASQSFQVEILDDDEQEVVETIGLALSNATGGAAIGGQATALLDLVDDEPCVAGDERLCLNHDRFRVEVLWRDFQDRQGRGQVEVLDSDDSGLFSYFDPDNLEMLVKVLDGCSVNGHFWVFAAAVTSVEYTLQVTDTDTGELVEYVNPLGISSPAITDTTAFATCVGTTAGAPSESSRHGARTQAALGASSRRQLATQEEACEPDDTTLCLNGGRFEVGVTWLDHHEDTGSGQIEPLQADDSGLFYFFQRDNLEMLVKVLDGCGINERYWVFAAATTDVQYTLTVRDTQSGEIREYFNELGTSSPAVTDTDAFAVCP